jgi:flagellar hook assembly protein FlgD
MDLTIKIYNIFGKKVYERYCFAGQNGGKVGNNELIWDGTDQAGHKLPMGSYPMVIYDGSAKTILDQWVIGVIH